MVGGLLGRLFNPQAQAPGAVQAATQSAGALGGLGAALMQMREQNPEAFIALGSGIMQGDMGAGFAGAGQAVAANNKERRATELQREGWDRDDARWERSFGLQQAEFDLRRQALGTEQAQETAARNATAAYLQAQGADPSLVQLAQAGQGAEAFRLFQGRSGGTFGVSPIYGRDAEGNVVIGQMGSNGELVQTQMPEGFQPLSPYDTSRERALGGAMGKGEGENRLAARSDIQAGENALYLIDSIRNDPARERGTGMSSVLNAVPGTSGYSFNLKVEQAKGGAFLSAIQQMRGMGALSNAEGAAATSAVTRMNTADTEEGFLAALDDYEMIVRQAIARAERNSGGTVSVEPQGPATRPQGNRTSTGLVWSVE